MVTLKWPASPGATGYKVYSGTSAGGWIAAPIATGVTATTYTSTGLTNGTTYYFRIKALNARGTSAFSSDGWATPEPPQPPAPAVPTGLTATGGNAQVMLAWIASANATSYNAYIGTSAGGWTAAPIATGVTTTTYTSTGLTNGTTYYYKLRAVNAGGTSLFSSVVQATPVL